MARRHEGVVPTARDVQDVQASVRHAGLLQEGGDLGWTSPGQMVPEFEKMMDDTAVNSVSPPFESQFGWHIVKVTGRRDHDMTEDAMRAKAMDYLHNRKYQEELDAWLRQIRDEAFVDIK